MKFTFKTIIKFFKKQRNHKIKSNYVNTLKQRIEKLKHLEKEQKYSCNLLLKNELSDLLITEKKIKKQYTTLLRNNISDLKKQKYDFDKAYYTELLTDEYINELIKFPKGLVYKNNDVVDCLSTEIYGRFTAYISPNGKVIHFKKNCSQAYIPINIRKFVYAEYEHHFVDFQPSISDWKIYWNIDCERWACQKCGHRNKIKFFSMPDWYAEFLIIQEIKRYYNITNKK